MKREPREQILKIAGGGVPSRYSFTFLINSGMGLSNFQNFVLEAFRNSQKYSQ